MVFEVNSIEVAKGIEYVLKRERFRDPNLVILLPGDNNPLPKICHGEEWKKVQEYILIDFSDETIERYKKLNAIAVIVECDSITIADLMGFAILELNCSYEEALTYLEYVLLGGLDINSIESFFNTNKVKFYIESLSFLIKDRYIPLECNQKVQKIMEIKQMEKQLIIKD